jgi:hypothetical protein
MASKCIYKILLIWGVMVILAALFGKVAIADDNGRTAADFLKIDTDARSAAMGGAYTAIACGPSALHWNPAGLMLEKTPQFSVSHFSWYQDINFEHLAVSLPLSDRLAMAGGITYLSYGNIEGYDQFDNPINDIGSTNDMALSLSAAYGVSEAISLGINAKYIDLNLAGTHASALAADFGISAQCDKYMLGISLSNIGQKIKFDATEEDLPMRLRIGVATSWLAGSLTAITEYDYGFKGNSAFKNGVEYGFEHKYFLRLGYNYQIDDSQDGLAGGMAFGAGAMMGPARIDYAYSPGNGVSSDSIHRFTVNFKLSN